MAEFPLSIEDIRRIKDEVKLTSKISLLFGLGLLLMIIIIGGLIIVPSFGFKGRNFLYRALAVCGVMLIPFIIISFRNLLWYFDIKGGMKISFTTSSYSVTGDREQLIIAEPIKLKIDAEYLLPHLQLTEPISVEVTKYGKVLLFISNDKENLLKILDTKPV